MVTIDCHLLGPGIQFSKNNLFRNPITLETNNNINLRTDFDAVFPFDLPLLVPQIRAVQLYSTEENFCIVLNCLIGF